MRVAGKSDLKLDEYIKGALSSDNVSWMILNITYSIYTLRNSFLCQMKAETLSRERINTSFKKCYIQPFSKDIFGEHSGSRTKLLWGIPSVLWC